VFSEKRLQTTENKGSVSKKEGKEDARNGNKRVGANCGREMSEVTQERVP
jgi:hypothetical protein